MYPPPSGATILPPSWFRALSSEQQRIATISARLYDRAPLTGACYLLTLFLHQFFKREDRIITEPVIGWINDGTDDVMISHAWIEYEGKKTDASIARTEVPEIQKPGPLIIHDTIIIPGEAVYTYHYRRSAAALLANRAIAEADSETVERKELEHAYIESVVTSDSKIRKYLDDAPVGRNYRALRELVLS